MKNRPTGRRKPGAAAGARGFVRIIGGEWRGRRLPIAGGPALRPTPDRVRETLFNWLAPTLPGARCLDLFAGTGALGFEALSRGAAAAVLVESDPAAVDALRRAVDTLGARTAEIVAGDALRLLATPAGKPFDVVFLDPPYQGTDYGGLCTLLCAGWLAPGAMLYLELDRRQPLPGLPPGWTVHREAVAGDVRYALARAAGTA